MPLEVIVMMSPRMMGAPGAVLRRRCEVRGLVSVAVAQESMRKGTGGPCPGGYPMPMKDRPSMVMICVGSVGQPLVRVKA